MKGMKVKLFYQELKRNGFGPFIGVPCSILKAFLRILEESKESIIATDEGEAMGIASGFYLTGRKPVVFMQNSGLCNALNPLVSLNLIYKIPILLIITLRGELNTKDAPQHKVMGQKTKDFLNILNIEYAYLTGDIKLFKKNLEYLKIKLNRELRPFALLVPRSALEKDNDIGSDEDTVYKLTRQRAINEIANVLNDNCLVISSTGRISREYYFCRGKKNSNFYMMGSMGCASAVGLGVAMGDKSNKRVVILDGDGAALMKMGNLATIGSIRPERLIHIVLDNQCHESTGGQRTASAVTALDKVAKSCGYLNRYKVAKACEIRKIVSKALEVKGPSFILVKISKINENDKLGRPEESPEQIKNNFIKQIRRTK